MALDELARKVINVLYEDSVSKINFHLGTLDITGKNLGRVADAIRAGDIKVIEDPALSGNAMYDSKANTMSLKKPDFTNVEFKGLLVHEAVHALIDINKAKETRKLAGEAAAYLAAAIYMFHELGDIKFVHVVNNPVDQDLGKIYAECLALMTRYKLAQRDVWLPPNLYNGLLITVQKHPQYRGISFTQKVVADGVGVNVDKDKQAGAGAGAGRFRTPQPLGTAVASASPLQGSGRKPGPVGA